MKLRYKFQPPELKLDKNYPINLDILPELEVDLPEEDPDPLGFILLHMRKNAPPQSNYWGVLPEDHVVFNKNWRGK